DPDWNLQEWKDLRGDLNQEPADNRVGDGNLVNVAPLQLPEEIARLHFFIPCGSVSSLHLRIGHSRSRARASDPSCVTACPRDSRSRVFMALLLPHRQFMSKAAVALNCANREAKRLEKLRGLVKVIRQQNENRHGISTNRIETSAFLYHR